VETSVGEYSFRNLILWQKAQALTLEVVQLTAAMPRRPAADVIVKQILRSASSIAANVAEGHGRFTPRAHLNHLSIAKGSACETDSWLDLMRKAELVDQTTEQRLHENCVELIAMLTAKIRDLERLSNGDGRAEAKREETRR